jgi:hypothetical protein
VFLLFIKGSFLCLLLSLLLTFNLLKHALVLPPLIRLAERILNHLLCKLLLSAFSVNTVVQGYHPEHREFDFM